MASDDYKNFLAHHEIQLVLSGVPSHFWPKLHEKLNNEIFDAGSYFSMLCQMDDDDDDSFAETNDAGSDAQATNKAGSDKQATRRSSLNSMSSQNSKWKVVVCKHDGISAADPSCVFLVDHAWTFQTREARKHLLEIPGLLERMCQLIDIESDGEKRENLANSVLDKIWHFCQTYSMQREDLRIEERMAHWYVLDEFGSRIRHSDEANFRMVPFFYAPEQISYSLLFPKVDVPCGVEITRDFVEGSTYHRPDWRQFYLLPWFPNDYSHLPSKFIQPGDDFFNQNRENESLPVSISSTPKSTSSRRLKVYSEHDSIAQRLTHPSFVVVNSKDDADVFWLHTHFKDYKTLVETRPDAFVNQFPFESVLTVKDLLAACVHLAYDGRNAEMDEKCIEYAPSWFPMTFNLRHELPQFISYFQKREKLDLENTWIIKPWNLARGLDTYVTNDLNQIIRIIDTGPKIACKYLDDPVLFFRSDINAWVKFDLRFIVLLRSVNPLKIYVYDRFWLRFALKDFSLDNFDDYEKHFTVFNYLDKTKILQMFCDDFVKEFIKQYPDQNWGEILSNLHKCIKETFAAACRFPSPKGLTHLPQSRAMYGVDMMLKWTPNEKGDKTIHPVMLEVNFMPDCTRACDYYQDFVNTVFETLFLDEINENLPITLL